MLQLPQMIYLLMCHLLLLLRMCHLLLLLSPPLTDSSPEQLVRRSHRLHRPPDCYSPLAFTVTALSKSASSRDAILHLEWQHTMAEKIAALE
jgi:hypothetical protein